MLRTLIEPWEVPTCVGIRQNDNALEVISSCCKEPVHASYEPSPSAPPEEWWICSRCKGQLFEYVEGVTPGSAKVYVSMAKDLEEWVASWVGLRKDEVEVLVRG